MKSPIEARDFLRKYGYVDISDTIFTSRKKYTWTMTYNGLAYSIWRDIPVDDETAIDGFYVQIAEIVEKELDRLGITKSS